MKSVGERIRYIRNQRGLSLGQLAEQARVSKGFLWEVERDRSGISGEKLVQIASALGTSLDFLLVGALTGSPFRTQAVEIPVELSDAAVELGLSHHRTLSLLDIYNTIVARRNNRSLTPLAPDGWRRLYQGVKEFLDAPD